MAQIRNEDQAERALRQYLQENRISYDWIRFAGAMSAIKLAESDILRDVYGTWWHFHTDPDTGYMVSDGGNIKKFDR